MRTDGHAGQLELGLQNVDSVDGDTIVDVQLQHVIFTGHLVLAMNIGDVLGSTATPVAVAFHAVPWIRTVNTLVAG